jgi:hypothetical protein
MRKQSGAHFDPALLEQFLSISQPAYEDIALKDRQTLDSLIEDMIMRHFGINLTTTPMKSKYSLM